MQATDATLKKLEVRIAANRESILQLEQETQQLAEEREEQCGVLEKQRKEFAEKLKILPQRTKDWAAKEEAGAGEGDPATVDDVLELMKHLSVELEHLEEEFGVHKACVKEVGVRVKKEEAEQKKEDERRCELARQHTPLKEMVACAGIQMESCSRLLDARIVKREAGSEDTDTDGEWGMDAAGSAASTQDGSALVFDCGTGETKCLKFSYHHGGTVEAVQVDGMKEGVVDFVKKKERGEKEFCNWTKKQLEANEGVATCIIGTSAWSRDPQYKEASSRLARELRRLAIVPTRLPQDVEAVFEAAAVAYAADKMDVRGLTGSIGSGGGSVQYSKVKGGQFVGMEIGHRKGMERLAAAEDPMTELAKWVEDTLTPELDKHTAHTEKLKGKVVAISACYYAASIKGVDLASDDDKADMHKASVVVQKMKAKLKELKQKVRADPTSLKDEGDVAQRKKRKAERMNLCNLTLQTMLYETFFDLENLDICFKREWLLPSEKAPETDEQGKLIPNFRTTWSAGWFLNYLRKQGVTLAESPTRVLQVLEEKEHDTIIFDCGTTETKALSYSFTRGEDPSGDPGFVQFDKQGEKTAPGALDFLEKRLPSECAKDRRGKEEYIDFGPDEVVSERLQKEDFVRFVDQEVAKSGARHALIGSSAWHRQNGSPDAVSLVEQLTRCGVVCKKLHGKEEALYESAAVAFAAAKLGVRDVAGVIGSGGGSVQYVQKFRDTFQLDVGWRGGQDRVVDAEDPLAVLEDWRQDSVLTQLDVHAHGVEKLKGKVVAISSCYYAASIVGVGVASEDNEAIFHKISEVVQKMEAMLEKLKKKVRADKTCLKAQPGDDEVKTKSRGKDAMNLCNLTLQTTLFKNFFDLENSKICFKRDWVLPSAGEPKKDEKGKLFPNFRSTWSAGYFLHNLKKQGISWPESNLALEKLESLSQAASREVQRITPELKRSESMTEHLAMRLVDLRDISNRMLKKAKEAEEEFVPTLRQLVAEAGGWLVEHEVRVMNKTFLYKKLIAKLEFLLQQNCATPSYVPSVKEIYAAVADCLRCTVVFPQEKYMAGVAIVEQHYVKAAAPEKCNTFSNFWHDGKGLTTRMGITATLWTKLKNGRPYVWTLDFHTKESLSLHTGEQVLIESLNDQNTSQNDKYDCYVKMKQKWDQIDKPVGVAAFAGFSEPALATLKVRSIWKLRERLYLDEYESRPAASGGDCFGGKAPVVEMKAVSKLGMRKNALSTSWFSAIGAAGALAVLLAGTRAIRRGRADMGTAAAAAAVIVAAAARVSATAAAPATHLHGVEEGSGQDERFTSSQVRPFEMAESTCATHGIWEAMGIVMHSPKCIEIMASCYDSGYRAIQKEFEANSSYDVTNVDGFGSDLDRFQYVVGTAQCVTQTNQKVRDGKHHNKTLDNFCDTEQAKEAKLSKAHVIALRLYTSNSFYRINGPLRDGIQPHPFPATTYYIYDGLRRLRDLNKKAYERDRRVDERIYWRGLSDVVILEGGINQGCDRGCMSTSRDEKEAIKWAKKGKACKLLLKLCGKNWPNWGVDMGWISMYADEKEELFPPLSMVTFDEDDGEKLEGIPVRKGTLGIH